MAHILASCAKDLAEEVDREKGAGESVAKTMKEKLKAAESTEKKAAAAEKNRALAEKRCSELLVKQNETDVKLAEAISLNISQAEELTDLRAALEACEQKWYNERFADAKKSGNRWWPKLEGWVLRLGGLPPCKLWAFLRIPP